MPCAWLLASAALAAATPAPCPGRGAIPDAGGWDPRRSPEPPPVTWASVDRVRDPSPRVSLEWALLQLLPSPELGLGEQGAVFGLRWQLTPVSYSFATDPRASRWRFLVVEPIVRHSGSIELFVSPEWLAIGDELTDGLGGRVGLRSYFGLIQRGDNLSVSIASAYYRFGRLDGVSYEAGAYVLFGMLGVQLTYAPDLEEATWVSTLRLRYF